MDELLTLLRTVRKPGRYLGREVNAVRKDPTRISCRLALAFPDLYEVGMSYFGLQVLYSLVNAEPDLWAERVFAPDRDLETTLREAGKPLCSLESRTPLEAFDAVGFSLQHELNLPDVLSMLALGGVPLRAVDRTDRHPIVLAGGPVATNPEPLAEVLDLVYLGDAEPALCDLLRDIGEARRAGRSRQAVLDRLLGRPGVYLPGRYAVEFEEGGRLRAVLPRGGAPARVSRVCAADLPPAPTRLVVPAIQAVHDRLTVEIQRGCTRGCRFCQAGMINRPVRQRDEAAVLAAVASGLEATGHTDVSFLSLSAGDHPRILELLTRFFERFGDQRVSVSLPSLRAETLTPALAERLRTVRKSGFTIAPEAGSERLRRVLNKHIPDDEVIRAAQDAFSAGWRLIKLYFMVGLPTEEAADREAIPDLVARLHRALKTTGHRPEIHVGISNFVPKAHTPFQWEAMRPPEELEQIGTALRRAMGFLKGVKVSTADPALSVAEAVLARGDRRFGEHLLSLPRQGVRLCAWSEHFDRARFASALTPLAAALDPLRERGRDEVLPWDHLDLGPSKEFLWAERLRAREGAWTPDCARDPCHSCGACGPLEAPRVAAAVDCPAGPPAPPRAEVLRARVRMVLCKEGEAALHGHLEFMAEVLRALRRAGWPLLHSLGFHPKPRVSFGPACPAGLESFAEVLEIQLCEEPDRELLLARLGAALQPGLRLLWAEWLAPDRRSLMDELVALRYRIGIPTGVEREEALRGIQAFLAQSEWKVVRESGSRPVDLRPSVRGLQVDETQGLDLLLDLNPTSGPQARPAEVVQALFGRSPGRVIRERAIFAGEEG